MSASVGNLVANFLANTTGFTKPVQAMRKETASFAASMKSSIGSIMGAFAPLTAIVAPIAGAFAFKHVVDSAREAAGAAKKFQAVLDATGGAAGISTKEMQEFAGQLQKTTNFEDDATVGAAALLATFTNIRGDTFKRAIESAMDFATVTGTDLPAAISLIGKALNDPINGMMKLRKAGIQLTEEQKKQVAQFQKAGDIAGAQAVILDAMQGRFGGAAKAMASPFTQVANIIGDISENVGFALLPVLKEITSTVIDWAGPLQDATDLFKQFGEDVAMVFRNFGDFAQIVGADLVLGIIDAVPELEETFQQLSAGFAGIWEAGKVVFDKWLIDAKGGMEELKNLASVSTTGFKKAIDNANTGKWDTMLSDAKGLLGIITFNPAGLTDSLKDKNSAVAAGVSEFINQKGSDVDFINPFEGVVDNFTKGANDVLDEFGKKGLGDTLRETKERLLKAIGERESERERNKNETEKGKTPDLPGAKHGSEKLAAEAAVFNSKEALHSIFTAMGTKGQNAQDRAAAAAERTADAVEEEADVLEEIAKNTKVFSDVEFVAVVV